MAGSHWPPDTKLCRKCLLEAPWTLLFGSLGSVHFTSASLAPLDLRYTLKDWFSRVILPNSSKRQMLDASDHPHAKAQSSAYIIWNKQKHNGYYKGDYPARDHEFRIMQNRRRSILKSSQRKRHLNEAAMRNIISPNALKCPMQSPVGKMSCYPIGVASLWGLILSVYTFIYEVFYLPKHNASLQLCWTFACFQLWVWVKDHTCVLNAESSGSHWARYLL